MTRSEVVSWAESHGWTRDSWGHYQYETQQGKRYRLKLSRIAARYEVRTDVGWVRLMSGYYRDLSINADGKLSGMKR